VRHACFARRWRVTNRSAPESPTDPETRTYATRRRAQGKTNREIKRCLIRYVARQLYRLLETQPALDPT
jgi:hypothetical protein